MAALPSPQKNPTNNKKMSPITKTDQSYGCIGWLLVGFVFRGLGRATICKLDVVV